mgnify:CR=1 FL=1
MKNRKVNQESTQDMFHFGLDFYLTPCRHFQVMPL